MFNFHVVFCVYLPMPTGSMGKPVYIDKNKLSKDQRKDFDAGWNDHAFNRYASDMMSLHRTLADVRNPK